MVIALAGSGCAQLLGIDVTSSSGTSATLDVQRASIGTTVVLAPLDLTTPPTFFDASAPNGVAATQTTLGTWGTTLADATDVAYTAPDLPTPFEHDIEIASSKALANFIAFEHPSPQPAPASMLMLEVTLPDAYAATQTLEVAAIGAWTHYTLSGMDLPIAGATSVATTLPYASFTATTASPPAQITMQDTLLVLRYSGTNLTGVFQVPSFDQTEGTDPVMGAMTAVVPGTPFDATIDPTTLGTRFDALKPSDAGLTMSWRLDASPGYAVGATTGVQLGGAAIAPTDLTFSSTYTNPFDALQWQPMLSYSASETRSVVLGGATANLQASMLSIVDPAAGLILDAPAGLPTMISIDQTLLTTDAMTVTLDPTTPLEVDFMSDVATSTYYSVTVAEIAVVGTSVTRTAVITVDGPAPQLTLPPNTLKVGHTYTLAAACIAGGYPNAATGDLQTFALPISIGEADSAVFTVVQ